MAFTCSVESANGVAKLTLTGELDAASAADFRAGIEEAAATHPRALVLMLARLDFMASAGLRALVFAKQKMGASVDIYVVAAQDSITETLELTGFHNSVIALPSYDASVIEQPVASPS
jgi:anti-anti-sigma factor